MYSDSIIVDAVPQQTQRKPDENGIYIKNNGKVALQVEAQENLSRQQVVHMLKNRFRNDFEEWQNRKDQRVSKTHMRAFMM